MHPTALETRPHCLTLPARCLVTEKQKKSVLVVEGGKVKKVEVTIGADGGSHVEITCGLKGDEEVLIRGSGVVKGSAIHILEVLQAPEALTRARRNFVNALGDYNQVEAALRYTLGGLFIEQVPSPGIPAASDRSSG